MRKIEDEDEDEDEEEEGEGKERKKGEKVSFGAISLGEEEADEDDDDDDEEEDTGPKQVWRPKDALEEGEELEYDPSTYNMLHSLGTQWPCLSFAFLPDNLGANRTKYPHTVYLAAGTQAGEADENSLILMKISGMNKTKEDSDDEFDSEDEGEDDDPILETASFSTPGINKVKVMPQQEKNTLLAMWVDTGKVQVYDLGKYVSSVDSGSTSLLPKKESAKYQVTCHKNEGFALDWSPTVMGRLLSGDCDKFIYETDFYSNATVKQAYTAHTGSVEDLQWSPSEKEVFASCSVDTTVKIWDSRASARKAMISVKVHKSDVNTLSWNKKVPYLIATGSDDCAFSIWDLRKFNADSTVAHFTFHDKPICCVEWNPNEDTQLVVVSEDNQVTIWDMGLEADDGEEPSEFPPQLFFMHQGQKEVKEAHWHPQIPNLVATTSADGFNLFITANSTEVAPPE
eukprot:Phypoly_transcript_06582.p1 GENE.Phypoly_transcript_06582~~Phypoly_transcript_06582.p1  ORF type:complete len:456 (+),score=102.34 Phypoly_transcript_06582:381-1748(+)